MLKLKHFFLSLIFIPFIASASTAYMDEDEQGLLAADRYYDNVPLLCYAGFRAVIDLLPELTHQLNMKMGADLIIIDNVVTPVGYDNVFEFDVLKSITPKGVGHYTLAQTYKPGVDPSTGTLYLNFTTKVPGQVENVWKIFDVIMNGCATNLPDKPTIPGIPG